MGLANRENLCVQGHAGKGIVMGTKVNVEQPLKGVNGAVGKKMVTRAALKTGLPVKFILLQIQSETDIRTNPVMVLSILAMIGLAIAIL